MTKKKPTKKPVKKTTKKKETIITQSAAADIAGVSRAAIGDIKKRGSYNFFVNLGTKKIPKWKVDIKSKDWKSYLNERGVQGSGKINNKKSVSKSKTKGGSKGKQKKSTGKNKIKSGGIDLQSDPFTGGVSPHQFIPQNTADLKRLAEISKIKLEIEKNLGLYIDREMLQPILESIGRNIHAHFVNLPRKLSGRICKKLNRVGMEKVIEKIMSEQISKGIAEVKAAAIKAGKVK